MNYQLNKRAQKHIRKIELILKDQFLSAENMFRQRGNITVIPFHVVEQWIDLFPAMLTYCMAKRNLNDPTLSTNDRWKIEKQFNDSKYIEIFVPEVTEEGFQGEQLSTLIFRKGCTDVMELIETNELCILASKFFPNIDLIREIERNRQVSLAQYDLSSMEDFQLDLLQEVDIAANLNDQYKILPLKIYCEFCELVKILGAYHGLDVVTAAAKTTAKELHAINHLRNELGDKIKLWINAYPFLSDKPLHDMDRLLLDFYTRSPSEIIEIFGPEEICFPYVVPEEMKNPPFSALNN